MQANLPYDKITVTLGSVLDSNTYIVGNDGVLLGYNERRDVNNEQVKTMFVEEQFPESCTGAMAQLIKTEVNIPVTSDITAFPVEPKEKYSFGLTTVTPIFGAGERLRTITLSHTGQPFADGDLVLAKYGATIVGMRIFYQKSRSVEADVRSATAVQVAINTLPYSELKTIQTVFEALDGDEGRLTASSIADSIGITRSMIVNALRKLESAGVIESCSLGMRGTCLKVLNSRFKEELARHSY